MGVDEMNDADIYLYEEDEESPLGLAILRDVLNVPVDFDFELEE